MNKKGWLRALAVMLAGYAGAAGAITLTNPIVFVTQPPIPRELNSSVSNTFLSVVTGFGNHLPDTAHAARGGDLWLMTTNGGLVNLTRKAGFGTNGAQAGVGISVRDPAIHWSGKKVLFSMVVGAPVSASDATTFYWQIYELTNLDAMIASTNNTPVIVRVANQPANYNNVSPAYGTDGRIIFTSDRPYGNQAWLYPQRDEYKGAPSVTGIYSFDPATGDLKLLEHQPSGAFNPFIDSYGRLIFTRWDHLIQDPNASNDRLGRATNGSFNFLTEAFGAQTQATNLLENFPEPDDFDTNAAAALNVTPNGFNLFLPWVMDQAGGAEEVLNHVGRHELLPSVPVSFTNDANLIAFTNALNRPAFGIESANTNVIINSMLQIVEDPRTNGTYWGVDAQDISIFGGAHAAGQIMTLTGGLGVNPTNMVIQYVTQIAGANGPTSQGLFRNPLPMSDGTLIAAWTATPTGGTNHGYDYNLGTASAPVAVYQFRLMTLTPSGSLWVQNQTLTPGLTNVAIYYDGATFVTNAGPLWELQPVEVRVRAMPAAVNTPVATVEQQVFAEEGVDLPTFQADLAQRGLALVVSRNVTARDGADKQQPYNLSVPGGVQTLGTNTGKIYHITHLQYLQADYLRGYTLGLATNQPGRRVLATPLHTSSAFNPASALTNAPPGGTQIMSDGSQATIVPAGRAVTWQLTGITNESVVKERYWISFRPGEVRTCANCHGINDKDQAGHTSPTNKPLALRAVLQLWRTNAANAYALSVNNGTGGGSYGAGSVVALTANAAPSGQTFVGWSGSVSNAFAKATTFIMPTNNASVTAIFTNLPTPVFNSVQIVPATTNLTVSAQAFANQSWILQSSGDLVTWHDIATNVSSAGGVVSFTNTLSGAAAQQFFRIRSP